MAENGADPQIDSDAEYRWYPPDLQKLASTILDVLIPGFAPPDHFTGSIGKEGPPRERISYNSPEDWARSVTGEAESVQFQLWKSDVGLHGYFYPRRSEASVGFHAKASQAEPAKAMISSLVQKLGLEPKQERSRNLVRLEGNYRLQSLEDTAWLERAVGLLTARAGDSAHFVGYFRLASTAQFREEIRELAAWQKTVTGAWKDVLEAGCSLGGEVSARLRCDRMSEEVHVTAEGADAAETRSILAKFEETANLSPIRDPGGRTPVSGERRRYFAQGGLSPEWLTRGLSILERLNRGSLSFQGRFRVGDQEYSRSSFEAWKSAVTGRWEELSSFYCWFSSFGFSQTLDVDLNREIVSLELQGRTESTVADTFGQFESDLKLKRFEGNPYQYRKFARVYRIEEWKGGGRIAEAVEAAVKIAFPGGRRQITSAYITTGEKAEDLEGFQKLDLWLDRLRKPEEYRVATLVIEGPHGRTLGIFLDRSKNRLQLRSSIERSEYQAVVAAFEERLDLTLDKIEDAPVSKDAAAKSGMSVWIPVVAAGVGAAASLAVALLTSASGLPSLKATLEITAPARNKDNVAEVTGGGTPVRWTISRKTLVHGEKPEECAATLIVEREGTEQPRRVLAHRAAGDFVPFPEAGMYYLTVKPEGCPDVQAGTIRIEAGDRR